MSLNSILIALHVLSAVVWVGGMFFAYMALRPVAATLLEPPQRLPLWEQTFGRFFPWVWAAIVILLGTGYWMIFGIFGGMGGAPLYVHVMNGLGTLMILIFLHVFFAPYRRLRRAVGGSQWQEGGRQLGQIRRFIGINVILGLITVATAAGGRYAGF